MAKPGKLLSLERAIRKLYKMKEALQKSAITLLGLAILSNCKPAGHSEPYAAQKAMADGIIVPLAGAQGKTSKWPSKLSRENTGYNPKIVEMLEDGQIRCFVGDDKDTRSLVILLHPEASGKFYVRDMTSNQWRAVGKVEIEEIEDNLRELSLQRR